MQASPIAQAPRPQTDAPPAASPEGQAKIDPSRTLIVQSRPAALKHPAAPAASPGGAPPLAPGNPINPALFATEEHQPLPSSIPRPAAGHALREQSAAEPGALPRGHRPEVGGTLASAQGPLAQGSAAHSSAAQDPAAAEAPAPQLGREEGKICRSCGARSSKLARFCQICGTPLEGGSGERPRSRPPELEAELPQAELVVIAQDGSPGKRFKIDQAEMLIGKGDDAQINLRKDPYVSDAHARLVYRSGRFTVEDLSPINGVYARIRESVDLRHGDKMLFGLAVVQFELIPEGERNFTPKVVDGVRLFGTPPTPRYARLSLQTVEDTPRDLYYLSRSDTVVGREVGDIVFTDDPFMSRRHAAIRRDSNTNRFSLRDLGSSNGTFIAIRGSHVLSPGDHLRVGQHLFRLDIHRGDSI